LRVAALGSAGSREETTMAENKTPDPSPSEEARNLAKEAVEEIKHGNKEEGNFILDEAKKLDPKAAEEVAKGSKKK
jgi:hypothetical protein